MVIDGIAISKVCLQKIRAEVGALKAKPKLVAILVGEDSASQMYVAMKRKRALEVGIESEIIQLAKGASKDEVISTVDKLNKDTSVTGILIQLPFPNSLLPSQKEILDTINPLKDVDCLTSVNTELLSTNTPRFLPATVHAILDLIQETKVEVTTSTMTIIGQGQLVGYPLGLVMKGRVAKLNLCDINTNHDDLVMLVREADILVTATGKAKLITAEMVKPGAVVIDCGAPIAEVDFESVSRIAAFITPVPGGVGPMTVVSLLKNTVKAFNLNGR